MTYAKWSQTVVTDWSLEKAQSIVDAASRIRDARDEFREISRRRPYEAQPANKAFEEYRAAWSRLRTLIDG